MRRRIATRPLSAITAVAFALAAGAAIGSPPAGATTPSLTWAYSQFLTGTAGATDLSALSGVGGLGASYPTVPNPAALPIDAGTIDALPTMVSGVPLFGAGGILDLGSGTLNQVASASSNGDLLAATGAVDGAGVPDLAGLGTPATLDATSLLAAVPSVSSALSQLKVTLDGIAATATQTAGNPAAGTSGLSGGVLTIASPIVAGFPSSVLSAVAPVQTALDGLGGASGGLAQAVNGIPAVQSILSALGLSSATNTVTLGNTDLATTVAPLLDGVLHSTDGLVDMNLDAGTITADLAGLLGGDLSSLPVGSDLLSPTVLALLSGDVSAIIQQLISDIEDAVRTAIGATPVSLTSTAGSVLGVTRMDITADGTIDEILAGTASTSTLLTLLGVPLSLSQSDLLSALSAPIDTSVINGALPGFATALTDQLGTPTDGSLSTALESINSVVGMTANVQSLTNGVFTQTALLTTLLPGADPLALLGLGSASLGTAPAGAPTATSLSPVRGPAAGGQQVRVTGTNFVPGLTSVHIGGTTVTASAGSTTSLTFTTPKHSAGSTSLTVQTPAGTSGALTYRYLPRPAAAALHPASGPTGGGRPLTISGAGFVPGATTVKIGGTTLGTGKVTVVSASRVSVRTPAHVAGRVSVSVTTPGGTSSSRSYTYRAAPRLTGMSTGRGPTAGGKVVTLTGARFVPGQTGVRVGSTTLRASEVTVLSSSKLRFTTPAHAAGRVGVAAFTVGGSSTAKPFRYVAGARSNPRVTGLRATNTTTTGGARLTLTGSGFVPGSTSVRFGATTLGAAAVTVVSPTRLWVLTPPHAAGRVAVRASTAGHASNALSYRLSRPSGTPSPTVRVTGPATGSRTSSAAPFVGGTGRAGAAVTVVVDGLVYCTARVAGNGRWSCAATAPLLAGNHVIRAREAVAGHSVSRLAGGVAIRIS